MSKEEKKPEEPQKKWKPRRTRNRRTKEDLDRKKAQGNQERGDILAERAGEWSFYDRGYLSNQYKSIYDYQYGPPPETDVQGEGIFRRFTQGPTQDGRAATKGVKSRKRADKKIHALDEVAHSVPIVPMKKMPHGDIEPFPLKKPSKRKYGPHSHWRPRKNRHVVGGPAYIESIGIMPPVNDPIKKM